MREGCRRRPAVPGTFVSFGDRHLAELESMSIRLHICLLSEGGEHLDQLAGPPDVDSLKALARRIEEVHSRPTRSCRSHTPGPSHDYVDEEAGQRVTAR